ncbi:MAG: response regulator transcription factor, partial [Candidatus Subteraquimicrobiales bacterium]|nr:response regulator transcription factor [Candidatus Subteraquimicrobiales bacterium]
MSKIKVFIADDHKLIREGLKSIFEFEEDIEIVGEAGDGQEAIRKIKETKPDVVLLDLKMPSADGVTVCREVLKENP